MKAVLYLSALLAIAFSLLRGASPISGTTTCPISGTRVLVSTSTKVSTYTIVAPAAPTANTGVVCFGNTSITTTTGPCLLPGSSYTAPTQGNNAAYDLSQVSFACTVNTDTLKYIAY